jgi:hypothetical protein
MERIAYGANGRLSSWNHTSELIFCAPIVGLAYFVGKQGI